MPQLGPLMGASVDDRRVFETINTCMRYGLAGRVEVLPGRTWKVMYGGREIVRQSGESGSAKPARECAELPLARYLAHEINIALLQADIAESAVYALQGVNVGLVEVVAALQQARERERAGTELVRALHGEGPLDAAMSTQGHLSVVEHLVLDQFDATGPLAREPVGLMSWHPPRSPGRQPPTNAAGRFGVHAPLPRPGSLDAGGGTWRDADGRPTRLLEDLCWWLRLTDGATDGLLPIADRLERAVEHLGVIVNSRGGRRARLDVVAERLQVASLAVRGIQALRDGRGR